ncbi:hypothetical protein [Actinomadura sp. NPDC048394]|uniref:hypothetical protein n=1 Tax=Actinomadura sp. NPDC048394 TaxID=3158223 RepID=UPI0033D14F30
MTERGGEDVVHLERLAGALERAGLAVQRCFGADPASVRVLLSARFGESVRVKAGVGGVPWFVASTADPLAPCHDTGRAVVEIRARVGSFGRAAEVLRGEAERRRVRGFVTRRRG